MSYSPIATGLATPTGTASTVFNVPHGMGTKPRWCGISAENVLSAAAYTVTWDATNVIVTYLTAITGALSLGWVAIG